MDTKGLKTILDWAKETDLEEVSIRKGGDAVEFKREGALSVPDSVFPPCSLSPIAASEVGIFRTDGQGKAVHAEEGAVVAKGQILGYIETGTNRHPVKAQQAGKVVALRVSDGQPVEFGQPLLFIQPA